VTSPKGLTSAELGSTAVTSPFLKRMVSPNQDYYGVVLLK
jgi:hypothetical protein